jgi:hypothetical protein
LSSSSTAAPITDKHSTVIPQHDAESKAISWSSQLAGASNAALQVKSPHVPPSSVNSVSGPFHVESKSMFKPQKVNESTVEASHSKIEEKPFQKRKKKNKAKNIQSQDEDELLEQAKLVAEQEKKVLSSSVLINATDDALKDHIESIQKTIQQKLSLHRSITRELKELIDHKVFAPIFLNNRFLYLLNALNLQNFEGASELLNAVRDDPMIPFPEALIDVSFYSLMEAINEAEKKSFQRLLNIARFLRDFAETRFKPLPLHDKSIRNEALRQKKEKIDETLFPWIDKHFDQLESHFEKMNIVFATAIQEQQYKKLAYLLKRMILSGNPGVKVEMSKAMPETREWKAIISSRFIAASEALDYLSGLEVTDGNSYGDNDKNMCSLIEILGELSEVLLYADEFPSVRPIKNVDPLEYKAALRKLVKGHSGTSNLLLDIWKQRTEWRFYHTLLFILIPRKLLEHSDALAIRHTNQETLLMLRDVRKLFYHAIPSLHPLLGYNLLRIQFLESGLRKFKKEAVVTNIGSFLDQYDSSSSPLKLKIETFLIHGVQDNSLSKDQKQSEGMKLAELLDHLHGLTLVSL